MSLFIAEDGSALENLCLLPDGVEVSAWLGSCLVQLFFFVVEVEVEM